MSNNPDTSDRVELVSEPVANIYGAGCSPVPPANDDAVQTFSEPCCSVHVHLNKDDASQDVLRLLADWKWACEYLAKGEFEQYRGQFVAVLEQNVAGAGMDQEELRGRISCERGVSSERVVIFYVDNF